MSYRSPIIVSNRSPIDYKGNGDKHGFSIGGLIQAMSGLLKDGNCRWVCYAGGGENDWAQCDTNHRIRYQEPNAGYDFTMKKVFIPKSPIHDSYSKFCNGFLWPIMHLTHPDVFDSSTYPWPDFDIADMEMYRIVNKIFSTATLEEALQGKEAPIWLQDYHLMMVSRGLKETLSNLGKDVPIGHFIHIPFPSTEAVESIISTDISDNARKRNAIRDVLTGVLGADLLGFHTRGYADNFVGMADAYINGLAVHDNGDGTYSVDYDNHSTRVIAQPIGVDTERFTPENLDGEISNQQIKELIDKAKSDGRDIFSGVERLDYTKGILERLSIMERLLESGHDFQYIGIAPLSRCESPGYPELQKQVSGRVEYINSKYSQNGFNPIELITEPLDFPDNVRLMRDSDKLFVTSLADGYNLVVLEGILANKVRQNRDRGSIIVGNCGCLDDLKGFGSEDGLVKIDPLDIQGSVDIIGAKSNGVSERLIDHVHEKKDVGAWCGGFLEALYQTSGSMQHASV